MNSLWRWVPLSALIVFVLLGVVWRSWHQARKHGTSGLALFKGSVTQNLLDFGIVGLGMLVGAQSLVIARAPERLDPFVVPVLANDIVRIAGLVVVLASTALLIAAQLGLGASWRIGIEEDARPGLVTAGFYAFCRNPIFLFLTTALIGFCGLLPTWISIASVIGTYVGIRLQVANEEAYLTRAYGDAYRAYAKRVGRFVPWFGRL